MQKAAVVRSQKQLTTRFRKLFMESGLQRGASESRSMTIGKLGQESWEWFIHVPGPVPWLQHHTHRPMKHILKQISLIIVSSCHHRLCGPLIYRARKKIPGILPIMTLNFFAFL